MLNLSAKNIRLNGSAANKEEAIRKAGEILEGIGGKSVFGKITSHAYQKRKSAQI